MEPNLDGPSNFPTSSYIPTNIISLIFHLNRVGCHTPARGVCTKEKKFYSHLQRNLPSTSAQILEVSVQRDLQYPKKKSLSYRST